MHHTTTVFQRSTIPQRVL